MSDPAYESLRIDRDGHVAEVVLLGPGKGNAMGPAFWREMPRVFAALDGDPEVRVILVRGNGPNFSFGLDIAAMFSELAPLVSGENLASQRTQLLELIGRMQESPSGMANCKKPVIAAISGWCLGGALDFITGSDIRLCSTDAKFGAREVRLAITPDVGTLQRLPRIIGDGQTRRLVLTGEDFDAQRALRLGLVSDVYDSPELLLKAAREMAAQIARNPPLVVQGIKHVMNYSADKPVADGLRYVALWNSAFLQSEDFSEAVAAFLEKRAPQFKGR